MARLKIASTRVSLEPKRIGIVAIAPVRPIDVVGPLEVFAEANRLAKGRTPYDIRLVSATSDRTIGSQFRAALVADETYLDKRAAYDTLLVAGGEGARMCRQTSPFFNWLREQCRVSRRYGSVCTGAMVLARAGLLDGHRATTHWKWCEELALNYPRIQVDPSPIFIRSGRYSTSAGVTAGIDLMADLVRFSAPLHLVYS